MIKKERNLKYLRQINTNAVLKVLATEGQKSRIDLSKKLNLSKMTITNIINDLMRNEYVEETKLKKVPEVPTTGPRPVLIKIKENKIFALGLYISRKAIYCNLSDIVQKEDVDMTYIEIKDNDNKDDIIQKVITIIDNMIDKYSEYRCSILGIGVSCIGLVNSKKGTILGTTDLNDFNIKDILNSKYNYPVFVRNETQASLIADILYGAGKNINDILYLGINHGVGTAVFSNGHLVEGLATEAGHMCVNINGEKCSCGNRGCLELYININTICKKMEVNTIDELLKKFDDKDTKLNKLMEEFINIMDLALTSLINIFASDIIIIGNEVSLFPRQIYDIIENQVNKHIIQRREKRIKILISEFKNKSAIKGASCIVFDEFFKGNIGLVLQYEQ